MMRFVGRIAWIAELEDDKDGHDSDDHEVVATGRFRAHVEDETLPDGFEAAPDDLPFHRALRWARARSPNVVIVRIYGPHGLEMYSAGPEEPPWRKRDRPPRWEPHRRVVRRRRYQY